MSRLSSLVALLASAFLFACPGPAPTPTPTDGGAPPDGGQTHQPPPDAGPPPLASYQGPLVLDTGTTTPSALRVALLWFPSLDTAEPRRPRAAETSPVSYSNPFPARWSLDVFSAPPQEAQSDYQSSTGGAGSRAFGELVLFRDVDGDGQLTLDTEGNSMDEIVGSSAGVLPFDADGPTPRNYIVWRSGILGTEESAYQLGFNLVRVQTPFGAPAVLPATSDLTLTVTGDARHALTFCEAAYATDVDEFACGQRVFLTPRVLTLLSNAEGMRFAGIQVQSGHRLVTDATVRLNGVKLTRDPEGGYLLFELIPLVITEGENQVSVEAPGLEPLVYPAFLPTPPTLLSPDADAQLAVGAQVIVRWQGMADSFDVTLSTENGGGDFLSTTGTEAMMTVPDAPGPASVHVSATAQRSYGRQLSIGLAEGVRDVAIVTP